MDNELDVWDIKGMFMELYNRYHEDKMDSVYSAFLMESIHNIYEKEDERARLAKLPNMESIVANRFRKPKEL